MNPPVQTLPASLYSGRVLLPDIAKGLAVVLMIQVHLTELFAVPVWFNGWGGNISLFLGGPPAAPVFMVLMGFFAAKAKSAMKTQIFRGLKLILWGLLLNIGLNLHLFIRIAKGQIVADVFSYLFGIDIFILAGLSLIVVAIFKQLAGKRLVLWLILMMIFGFLNQYLPVYEGGFTWLTYLQAAFNGYFHWSYFPLFPWGAYPVAGAFAYFLIEKLGYEFFNEKRLLITFVVLTVVLATTFSYGFQRTVLLQVYYHHDGLQLLWNLAFVLWLMILLNFLCLPGRESMIQNGLAWIGQNVTSLYVFQWLLIGNLATSLYQTQYPLQLLFYFITITLISALLAMFWKKVKNKFFVSPVHRQPQQH